jgi:hypothetical protein
LISILPLVRFFYWGGMLSTKPPFSVFLDMDWWWVYLVENLRARDDDGRKGAA